MKKSPNFTLLISKCVQFYKPVCTHVVLQTFLGTVDEAAMETDAADKAPPPPAEPTKQLKVTYELYKKIANMLVHYLRGVEEATGAKGWEGRGGYISLALPMIISRCLQVASKGVSS